MQGFKMHLKLRDQQLKTIIFIYRLLYKNVMVTTNQKFIIDIHTKKKKRTSLVAQWLRIHLPMQGIRVRSLVLEDPACRGVTKPVHHNY